MTRGNQNRNNGKRKNFQKRGKYSYSDAKKRKIHYEEEVLPKKFKNAEDLKDIDVPQYSDSDAESEEEKLDEYSEVLQSLGINKNGAVNSDEESEESDEDSDDLDEEEDNSNAGVRKEDLSSDEEEDLGADEEDLGADEEDLDAEEEDLDAEEEDLDAEEEDLNAEEEDSLSDGEYSDSGEEEEAEGPQDKSNGNIIKSIEDDTNSELRSAMQKLKQSEKNDGEENFPSESDPFSHHFCHTLPQPALELVRDKKQWIDSQLNWPILGKTKCQYPRPLRLQNNTKKKLMMKKDSPFYFGSQPPLPDIDNFDLKENNFSSRLVKNVCSKSLTDYEKSLLCSLVQYNDLYYPESTYDKWQQTTRAYCLHSVNHILKTRSIILRNNAQLRQMEEDSQQVNWDDFKDQGFACAKVLILLPSKHAAYRVIKTITDILGLKPTHVQNLKRFEEDYGPDGRTVETLKRKGKRKYPEDFYHYFEGNCADNFKMGITFSNRSMRLYSNFLNSDLIIASPMGLRVLTGVEGEDEFDADFLSSVEMLVIDQADILLMQNWDHVETVCDNLNNYPREMSGKVCQMQRVKEWLLREMAKNYRQTLLFSSYISTHHRAFFGNTLANYGGKMQVHNPRVKSLVEEFTVPCELRLRRIPSGSINDTNNKTNFDRRHQFFVNTVLRNHVDSGKQYTLLFIPDSSDYVTINHYLSRERIFDFSSVNEYIEKSSQIAAARSDFFKGQSSMLLYTERAHFYKRPVIKGIKHIIFYGLPTNPLFFPELCNMMKIANQNLAASKEQQTMRSTVTVMFQKTEALKLSQILGVETALEVINADKDIHVCTVNN